MKTEVFDHARVQGRTLRKDPANPYRDSMFDLDRFANGHIVVRKLLAETPTKAEFSVVKLADIQRK